MKRTFEQLWIIALTDFKLRYSNSILGYLWSLLKPLLIFLVLYVVFSMLMRIEMEHYQLHLLLGIILWNHFAESTSLGMNSLLAKANLITKLAFPRWILVVASSITSLMTLMLNLVVFFLFLTFSGIGLHVQAILFIVYLVELYLLILGISLALSVLQVKFRDVAQVWEVVLQGGFFLSPIVYSLSMVPEKYHMYLFLNPITPIVQYSRLVLISGEWPTAQGNAAALLVTGAVLITGALIFRIYAPTIAEEM